MAMSAQQEEGRQGQATGHMAGSTGDLHGRGLLGINMAGVYWGLTLLGLEGAKAPAAETCLANKCGKVDGMLLRFVCKNWQISALVPLSPALIGSVSSTLRTALGHEGMSLAVVQGEDFLFVYQLNWLYGQGGGFSIGIPVKVALGHRLWPDQGIDRLVA